MVIAYIGLGSNLEDPVSQIQVALTSIGKISKTELRTISSLYRSVPMGPQDQPDFINAVAKIKTALTPEALLSALQEIENQSGRLRTRHWGPRTLDLDIILYGRWVVDTAQLKIPHPGLYDRNFVLYPLQEIEPGIDIPGYGPIVSLLAACPKADLCVVSDV